MRPRIFTERFVRPSVYPSIRPLGTIWNRQKHLDIRIPILRWCSDALGFAKKRKIWEEYAARGFWTMMGDDWATTKWAFNSSGHPLDYRYKLVGEAMVKQFAEMERFVYVCLVRFYMRSRIHGVTIQRQRY